MDQRASLAHIAAPTMVIAGSDDPATTPEVCHELAAEIPGAIFAEVEASHIAAVEAADDFTELVLEHLQKG
jgi:pimeloyl-ACP methyl ester carboxylesterase